MKPRTLNNQDGIALGPILFIIAILAIIAAAIAAGSVVDLRRIRLQIQVKSIAQSIIQYANIVAGGVDKLVSENGCDDTQINFNNPLDGSYVNPNAPVRPFL